MTAVADCFSQPTLAEKINVNATRALAVAAENVGARFVFTSTDMVFGGDRAPYAESDPPDPVSVYGRSKAAAEHVALDSHAGGLVVRIPLLVGTAITARRTTFAAQTAALRNREPLKLFTDEYRTPLHLTDAAEALIALARSDAKGVMHVAGPERLSRYEMGQRFAAALGVVNPAIEPISRLSISGSEPRPADLSLDRRRFSDAFPNLSLRRIEEAIRAEPVGSAVRT